MTRRAIRSSVLMLAGKTAFVTTAYSRDAQFEEELLDVQHEWAAVNYGEAAKSARQDAFEALVEHSADFAERYPGEVAAVRSP